MPIRISAIRSLWAVTDFTTPPIVPQMMATIGIQANQGIDIRIVVSDCIALAFMVEDGRERSSRPQGSASPRVFVPCSRILDPLDPLTGIHPFRADRGRHAVSTEWARLVAASGAGAG